MALKAIALVRERKPEVYMRVVADLLPKEANINVEAGEAFVKLWGKISDGLGDELADRLDEEQGSNAALLFVTDVRRDVRRSPSHGRQQALEAVGKHDRVSIRSGHGVGKTTLEAWLILWFLLTRKNCKIPVAANSQDQLRDTIWPEIAKWHRQLPEGAQGE